MDRRVTSAITGTLLVTFIPLRAAAQSPADQATMPRWLVTAAERALSTNDFTSLPLAIATEVEGTTQTIQARVAQATRLRDNFLKTRPPTSILEQTVAFDKWLQEQPASAVTDRVRNVVASQLQIDPKIFGNTPIDLRDERRFRTTLEANLLLRGLEMGSGLARSSVEKGAAAAAFIVRDVNSAGAALVETGVREALRQLVPNVPAEATRAMDFANVFFQEATTRLNARTQRALSRGDGSTLTDDRPREWSTVMTGLSMVAYWVGQNDPEAGRSIMRFSMALEKTWTLANAVSRMSTSQMASYGGAVMAAGWVGVALIAVNEIQASQNPSVEEVMFAELLQIKQMLVHLEKLINTRFDHIEKVLDAYHKEQMEALKLLVSLASFNSDQLTAIRSAVPRIESTLTALQEDLRDNTLSKYRSTLFERTGQCLGRELPEETFHACLNFFSTVALSWSTDAPFIVQARKALPDAALLAAQPHSFIATLLQLSGNPKMASVNPPPHMAVWANGALPLVALLEGNPSAPRLMTEEEKLRAGRVIALGRSIEQFRTAVRSTMRGSSPDAALSTTLPAAFGAAINRVGSELKAFAAGFISRQRVPGPDNTQQQLSGVDLIDPVPSDPPESNVDNAFESLLPAKMKPCAWAGVEPAEMPAHELPVPRGIAGHIPAEIRLAAKLDPAGHAVDVCYQLDTREGKFYFVHPRDRMKPMFRYVSRYTLVVNYRMNGMPKDAWLNVHNDIGLFYQYITTTDRPHPEHATFAPGGELTFDQHPSGVVNERFGIAAIREYTQGKTFATFGQKAGRGWRAADGYRQVFAPNTFRRFGDIDAFVKERLAKLAIAFTAEAFRESATGSNLNASLKTAIDARSRVAAWLKLMRSDSVHDVVVEGVLRNDATVVDEPTELSRALEPTTDSEQCSFGMIELPRDATALKLPVPELMRACKLLTFAAGPQRYARAVVARMEEAITEVLRGPESRTVLEEPIGGDGLHIELVANRLAALVTPGAAREPLEDMDVFRQVETCNASTRPSNCRSLIGMIAVHTFGVEELTSLDGEYLVDQELVKEIEGDSRWVPARGSGIKVIDELERWTPEPRARLIFSSYGPDGTGYPIQQVGFYSIGWIVPCRPSFGTGLCAITSTRPEGHYLSAAPSVFRYQRLEDLRKSTAEVPWEGYAMENRP